MRAIEFRTVKMKIEVAVLGRQFHDLFRLHQLFPHPPVRDQTLDRANTQAMFLAKFHELGQARHGPSSCRISQSTPARCKTRPSGQINAPRYARPSQDSAILGP